MIENTIVAFIPVRGDSKGIPLKNIHEFCGKPLCYWTAKAASECALIDEVYVATDSAQIASVVNGFNLPKVHVIDRDPATATDSASTESAMLDFATKVDFETIVLIQATSPLLTSEDLTNGINKYFESNADSLLSAIEQKRFVWQYDDDKYIKPLNYNPLQRPRRQDFNAFLVENGAFYITNKNLLLKTKCRISGHIAVYCMRQDTYFEIDEPDDFILIEQLMLERQKKGEA